MGCMRCEAPGDWVIQVRLQDGTGFEGRFCDDHKVEVIAELDQQGFIGMTASMN